MDSVYSYFSKSDGNPLIVLPTGTGKSLVVAEFTRSAIEAYPDTRVLMLTHVKELIEQNYEKLMAIWPDAPAGVYSAGLRSRDLRSQIVFGGIQSLYTKGLKIGKADLVLVDEAHLMPRKSDTMYGKFLADLRVANPYVKLVGLTATPYRLDSGPLFGADDTLFSDVCYEMTLLDAIQQGWLAQPIPRETVTGFDLTGVGTRGGDFIQGQLERAVDIDEVTQSAVDEIVRAGSDRRSWLIFCSGVTHAEHVAEAVRARGVTCATITGSTPSGERAALLSDYKAGRIRCLTNMSVLTTGFDAPATDLIALMRPTKSPGLLVQMVGRGTRLSPGKENCVVLDFARNFERHGPLDKVRVKEKGGKGMGEAPTKTCPECFAINYAGAGECLDCGYEFPPPEPEVQAKASDDAILSTQKKARWVNVDDVLYFRHTSFSSGKTTLRVDYRCGLKVYSEWVCIEHTGFARQKAEAWWARRSGAPVPATVDAALLGAGTLAKPAEIMVSPDGEFDRVSAARFVMEKA